MIPKFRAWHKPMQRMSEVLAISYERQKVKIRHLRGTTHMTVLFDDVELMQSIGLFDNSTPKNEIFEGDIVEIIYDSEPFIGVVVYDLGETDFKATNNREDYGNNFQYLTVGESIKVIGNIYENPELLFKDLPEDDRQLTDFPTCPVCDERTYSEDTCPFWSSEWSVDRARI